MTAFLALLKKDLLLFRRDRRALIVTLVTPLVLGTFFGFLFGGRPDKKKVVVEVLLVDEDGGELAKQLGNALEKDEMVKLTRAPSADEARAKVRAGDVPVAVIVPKGFGDALRGALAAGGPPPTLTFVVDPSESMQVGLMRGVVTRHVMGAAVGGPAAPEAKLPFTVVDEEATAFEGARYDGFAHSFAGMGVQFSLFGGLEAAIAMLNERQRGLWRRLRAAPVARHLMLGARLASGALISFVTICILFLFARLVFGVHVGNLPGFLLVVAAHSLMVAAVGLLIAALGKTPAATRGIAVFVFLIAVMLGGGWVPTFIFPAFLQKVTLVFPTRWAVEGMDKMTWRGLGFGAGALHAAVLVGFALVFAAIALRRFRWED